MTMQPLIVGAVAYDAKVVPIWEGIRDYFRGCADRDGFRVFSNYEAQVEALLAGRIDVAWNTNLAYVRTHHARTGRAGCSRCATPTSGSRRCSWPDRRG